MRLRWRLHHGANGYDNFSLSILPRSPQENAQIMQKLGSYRISIGIKKLLGLLDMMKQMGTQNRVYKFLAKLEDEGFIVPNV